MTRRLKLFLFALALVALPLSSPTAALAEQVPNGGPEPAAEPGEIETLPVYTACDTWSHCGPAEVRGHFSFGVGRGWLTGQMAEVFDEGGVAVRIAGGVEVGPFAVDLVIMGAGVETVLDASPMTFSMGPSFRHMVGLHESSEWRVGFYSQAGFSFTTFSTDEEDFGQDTSVFEEYSGWGMNFGIGFLADYYMLRMFMDATREWMWLENESINRHINGGVWHWTTGLGVVF